MGYRKLSLGQMEQAVEGLQRELAISGCTLKGYKRKIKSVASATSLEKADSGSIILVSQASAYEIDLPTPEVGMYFMFILTTVHGSNSVTIAATSDGSTNANLFTGQLLEHTDGVQQKDNLDVVTIVGGTATIGDFVKVWCVGTGTSSGDPTWYVEARADGDNAITIA
jgi:hypothetical protein